MSRGSTLALPSLFAIMFLSILVSMWISTAEAFVIPGSASAAAICTNNAMAMTKISATTTRLFDVTAQEALELTKRGLEEMEDQQNKRKGQPTVSTTPSRGSLDPRIDESVREYLSFPANELKRELKSNGLPTKGRKPDLAKRLAEFEYLEEHPHETTLFGHETTTSEPEYLDPSESQKPVKYLDPKGGGSNDDDDGSSSSSSHRILDTFCGLSLSETAGTALGRAGFDGPTPIQRNALPSLVTGRSAVLHAAPGSGKTLAYLLPITEALWKDERSGGFARTENPDLRVGWILTPTCEMAVQVAGVASALAPPGSVRLVSQPTNLLWSEGCAPPRLVVGSAKTILGSLYGDGKLPAAPTPKSAAKELLSQTRWIVLDEVDRLLQTKTKKGLSTAQRNQRARKTANNHHYNYDDDDGAITSAAKGNNSPLHEKPAAVLTAAIARRTLGRVQVIAASATVGRSLKRELSRVLGLPPKEYPLVIHGDHDTNNTIDGGGRTIRK